MFDAPPATATPGLALRGRLRLDALPAVLAAGADGVGAQTTPVNALYAALDVLRGLPPRMLEAVHLDAGAGQLWFRLHPAGGLVVLTVGEDGGVDLDATTGLCGPGYHRFLLGVARQLAEVLGADWRIEDDPVPETHFLAWLHRHAEAALAADLSRPEGGLRWLPPLLPGTGIWQGEGAVATVVGPRSRSWLQAVARDPAAGRDAFPWWEEGRGVPYLVGRARTVLWREARWRVPTNDEELAALSEVANLLAEAWEAAPALQDAPWAAWHEVLVLLEEADDRRARVAARAGTERGGGYRRHRVRQALPGGWWSTLPGAMGVSWTEEEGFVAWADARTVWASVLVGEGDGVLEEGEVHARWPHPYGEATVLCELPDDPDDPTTWIASGRLRHGDTLLVLTLAWQDGDAGRRWARHAWDSLTRDEAPPPDPAAPDW